MFLCSEVTLLTYNTDYEEEKYKRLRVIQKYKIKELGYSHYKFYSQGKSA